MASINALWSSSPWSVQLLVASVLLIATLLTTTYLTSLYRSWPKTAGQGQEPPVAPYWLPGLQHLVAFLLDPARTFQSTQSRYGDSPFTLLMGNVKFHVFKSPSTATHVFARSRTFAYEPVTMSMLENGLNLPEADRVHFQVGLDRAEKTGHDEKGFVVQNHNVWLKYLSGEPLDDLMQLFTRHFHEVLEQHLDMETTDWQRVDLYQFLRKAIFDTSVLTFFGPRLAQIWGPTMWEDFCMFNDATYIGVRTNLAYVLQPRAGRARERMLRAFEQWLTHDSQEWSEKDGMWNEVWGAKMNWERDHLAQRFGLSLRGRATMQASFLFAIILNAAPMGSWFTWVAASDPARLETVRAESSKFLRPNKSSRFNHELSIDAAQLRSNVFMQALWKEALRVGTAASPARVVMEDTELEGYVVRKGSVVLMPTALLHHSDLFPKADQVDTNRWIDEAVLVQQRGKSIRTFGGGMGMCSGRYAAEQEVIGMVSKLVTLFDIEFEDSWKGKFHFNPRSLGIMHPAGSPMVCLKRRTL